MLVLNFSHPLTDQQLAQIETLANAPVEGVRTVPVKINPDEPIGQQIIIIANTVGLSPEEWQTRPLLINPPGHAPAVFTLLAELHGRIGHFPTLIRLRPVYHPPKRNTTYEVAEILNLQTIRDAARRQR